MPRLFLDVRSSARNGGSDAFLRQTALAVAEAPHAPKKTLRRRGLGSVRMPGTLRHKAFIVRDGRHELQGAAAVAALAELMPRAPLVVIDDAASVAGAVRALKRAGAKRAVALHRQVCGSREEDARGAGA